MYFKKYISILLTPVVLGLFLFAILPLSSFSQNCERPEYGPRKVRNCRDNLDRKQGIWKTYYYDGQLRTEGNFVNNLADDRHVIYYMGGQMREEMNYSNGKKDGEFKKYFLSGGVWLEGKYTDGKKDEFWVEYYETGEKKKEIQYKNGVNEGEWKFYDTKGRLIYSITYKNGADVNAKPPAPKTPSTDKKKPAGKNSVKSK